jgi:DNA-directed RNA polymerase subunit RPC12/RpoP
MFRRIFGSKKIGDYEIEKTVKCAKCGKKIHIPKEYPELRLNEISIVDGRQCETCGKYYCFECTWETSKPGWRVETAGTTFRCCGSGFISVRYIE